MHRRRHNSITYYDFESDFHYQQQLHETMKSRTAVEYNRAATEEFFKSKFENSEVILEHDPPNFAEPLTNSVIQFMHYFQRRQTLGVEYTPAEVDMHGAPIAQVRPFSEVSEVIQVVQGPEVPPAYHHHQTTHQITQKSFMHQSCQTSQGQIFQVSQASQISRISQIQQAYHLHQETAQSSQIESSQVQHFPEDMSMVPLWEVKNHFHTSPSKPDPTLHTTFLRNLKQRILNEIQERTACYNFKRQIEIMDALSDVLDRDPLEVLEHVGYQAILRNDEYNIPKTARNIDKGTEQRNERKLNEMAEEIALSDLSLEMMQSCDKYSKLISRPVGTKKREIILVEGVIIVT